MASTPVDNDVPARPSAYEKEQYYYGLASRPALVARTSTTTWPPGDGPPSTDTGFFYSVPVQKRLVPISQGEASSSSPTNHLTRHKILQKWSPSLRDSLIDTVESSPIGQCWSSILPLRIESRWANNPNVDIRSEVVLLIGVPSDRNTTWEMGLSAALSCRNVLAEYGVTDVEVEVYESSVLLLTDSDAASTDGAQDDVLPSPGFVDANGSPSETEDTAARIFEDAVRPFGRYRSAGGIRMADEIRSASTMVFKNVSCFLNRPGQMIERTVSVDGTRSPSGVTGSLCLYIALGQAEEQNDDQPVFALTSRHVAVGREVAHDKQTDAADQSTSTSDPQLPVLRGSQKSLEKAANSIDGSTKRVLRKRIHNILDTPDGVSNTDAESGTQLLDVQIPHLTETMRAISSLASEDNVNSAGRHRAIGHVEYAAPHPITTRGGWNDWALIRLNKATTDVLQQNANFNAVAVERFNLMDVFDQVAALPESGLLIRRNADRLLPLDAENTMNDQAISGTASLPRLVAKVGCATGFTVGIACEIEAVFRLPLEDGLYRIAKAIPVLPCHGEEPSGPISKGGDLGSVVFDMEGHVIGMLAGGSGINYRHLYQRPGGAPAIPEGAATSTGANLASLLVLLGRRPTEVVDVTFVTPIEWILKDVEARTGRKPRVL